MTPKQIEKFIASISAKRERIEEEVERRNEIAEGRSDKWQESEACELYEEKTYNLECAAEYLQSAEDELENAMSL